MTVDPDVSPNADSGHVIPPISASGRPYCPMLYVCPIPFGGTCSDLQRCAKGYQPWFIGTDDEWDALPDQPSPPNGRLGS